MACILRKGYYPVTTEMDKPCPIWKFTADNQAKIGLQGIGFQYAVSYHPVQLLDLVCKKLPSQNFHLFPIGKNDGTVEW